MLVGGALPVGRGGENSQVGASEEVTERIMAHLQKERYLDAARFCRFYVRDKYRFNQWGRMKIAQMLRMKRLSDEDIRAGLEKLIPKNTMES